MGINEKITAKKMAILDILKSSSKPVTSIQITRALTAAGHSISERSVRLYLEQLEQNDLVKNFNRKGRMITDHGLEELGASTLLERVGYMSAKIDKMTFNMNFDLATRTGTVLINVALIPQDSFRQLQDKVCKVFEKGYAMGCLVGLHHPGETVGNIEIPKGMFGFCTVCSVTLNGVLLKHCIPIRSQFCGLLELVDSKPRRFAELINYDSTSVDPLELFIKSGMTNYLGAIENGNGRIGAGFREIPAESRDIVVHLANKLRQIDLGAFLTIGQPGQPLFNIPVREGCCGIVVIGGLNPVAILEESGVRIQLSALAGLAEYNSLFHYSELPQMLQV